MKLKKRFRGISASIVLSLALSFLVTVYAPIELFVASQEDFWFGAAALGENCAVLFGICTFGLTLLYFLLRLWGGLPYRIGLALGTTLLIGGYVQGNFLVAHLPTLDGTAPNWNAVPAQRWLSIGLFVLLFALQLFLLLKFKKRFRQGVGIVGGALLAMLAITLTTLLLSTPLTDKEGLLKPTDRGDLTFSTDRNLIVLITDAADNGEFMAALEANEEFSDTFADFTNYDDALAGYPFTRNALPLMLTGQWYENDRPYEQYVSEAFGKSPLLQQLQSEDYRIGLYNNGELAFDAATYDGVFENQINVSPRFTSSGDAFALIFKMTAIRYAPWDLKRFGYDAAAYADSIRVLPDVTDGDVKKSNALFYDAIQNQGIELTDQKCARIQHIEGAHVPFVYNKAVEKIENGTYPDNLEATLTICRTFLQTLKDSGVYDNSVIVILGDHGFNNTDKEGMGYRMNPVLLIKGIGEHGTQMRTDSTPLSYEQLPAALVRLMEGKSSHALFPADAYPDGRRFIGYWYSHEESMEEYLVLGKANEVDKMQTTGQKYYLQK